ncbi:MAG: hypothetical protein MAG431_01003 [Chloroflexi bacterium]|nr:hypothetical protein [Chloroflexota bacterium]
MTSKVQRTSDQSDYYPMTTTQIHSLSQQLTQAQELGDAPTQAHIHADLGKIFLGDNAYREAYHHYRQAITLFSELGRKKQHALALNNLAIIKIMTQRPREAIEDLKTAQNMAQSLEAENLQLAVCGNLGLGHAALGDFVKAVKFHKKVMEASLDSEDKHMQLQAQINLADAYLQDKRPQQALGFALVAHDLAQEFNAKTSLAMLLDLLGTIYSRQKDLRTAINYHQKAIELAIDIGDPHRQAIASANKALALEALTELEDAHQSMTEAQALFQMLNSDYAAKTQKDLARIREALGED